MRAKFFADLFQRWWHPGAEAAGPPVGLLMGMFFTYAGIGMVWSILTVYATSLGASAATAGATISAFGASRLLVSVPAGLISERIGRVRDMAAYQTATQIGLSLGPGLGGFAAALWGYGAPFACQGLMAMIALLAVLRIPSERKPKS